MAAPNAFNRFPPSGPRVGQVHESPLVDAEVPANDFGTSQFAVTGAVVGDVVVGAPQVVPVGLIVSVVRVVANGFASITFFNTTGAPIQTGSAPVRHVLFKA